MSNFIGKILSILSVFSLVMILNTNHCDANTEDEVSSSEMGHCHKTEQSEEHKSDESKDDHCSMPCCHLVLTEKSNLDVLIGQKYFFKQKPILHDSGNIKNFHHSIYRPPKFLV